MLAWLIDIQTSIQRLVADDIAGVASTGSLLALVSMLPLALLFGTVHALTPGHNKLVLASYVAGERLSVARATITALLLSATHIGTAVVVAMGANWLVSRTITDAGRAPILENLSRGFLLLIGLWMVFRALRPTQGAHAHNGLLALAAGLVPCPLTLFIMVFAISLGAPVAGLAFAAAMMLGVGLVLAGVALLASLAGRKMLDMSRMAWAPRIMEGAAGVVLVAMAVVQFASR